MMANKKNTFFYTCAWVIVACIAVVSLTFAQTGVDGEGGIVTELKLYSKALHYILEGYVDDLDKRELFYKAVEGMLKDLDKYTMFFDKEKRELLEIHMEGEYAGIGTALEPHDDWPMIKDIKPGSLAEHHGLEIGDIIRKVDGFVTQKVALPEVASMIRGESDVPVFLTVWRESTQKEFDVEIIRETIKIDSVQDIRMVGRAAGYLRISSFSENTAEQFDDALDKLKGEGAEALVIDLRNNDGGLMTQALALAERFLPSGKKILSVKSRVEEQQKEYFSSGEFFRDDFQLVILPSCA